MQQTAHSTPERSRERTEENKKFANDGSYESVRLMLIKIAGRCFGRVQALGLGMTFDDVLQEMNMTYVLVKEQWRPDGGALFSTYLTTSCYRNFNERIRRAETERRNLGLVNFTDMRPVGTEDDGDMDALEFHEVQTEVTFEVDHSYGEQHIQGKAIDLTAPMSADPQSLMMYLQESQAAQAAAREKLANLTTNAKVVISELLQAAKLRDASDQSVKLPRLRKLMEDKGFSKEESTRIRREVVNAFGVKIW